MEEVGGEFGPFCVAVSGVSSGVGGVIWQNISGICSVLAVSLICWV